jgi:ankyrin repeat protein
MARGKTHSSSGWTLLGSLALVLTIPFFAQTAGAHETDQFTIPEGREFAEIGDIVNRWFYDTIVKGVDKTNAEIKSAIESHASADRLRELQSGPYLAHQVNRSFPWAMDVIEGWDKECVSAEMEARFPGYVTGYKQPLVNIYQHTHAIIDPRQFFRLWLARTVKVYGHYIGTDKIGHFTDNGMNLYKAYEKALASGAGEEEANKKALWVSTDDPLFGEKGMVGYGSAGDYANGDLTANYTGYAFYRNLYEPMFLTGVKRPALCLRDGEYWKIAPHVQRDNDFMEVFYDDHLDEALNPGHFESGMRNALRAAVKQRRTVTLERYRDEHGCRRPCSWFQHKLDEMQTYYGIYYGHYGPADQIVSIPNTLFPTFSEEGNVNTPNEYGETALQAAAAEGDAAAVQRLLARGADPNAALRTNESTNSDWGSTPLHFAAASGSAQCVRLLIGAGANVNARNDLGVTPLHRAVRSPDIAALLLDRGANVSAVDARGRTPLHWAACDNENCRLVAGMLLDRKADARAADHDGRTPLHLAADAGRESVAYELLRRGADVNAPDHFRQTPLHLACMHRHYAEMVRALLGSGATANAADDFGVTPLHEAARVGSPEAVALLMRSGGSPALADAYGYTPFRLAQDYDHPGVLAVLPATMSTEPNARTAAMKATPPGQTKATPRR